MGPVLGPLTRTDRTRDTRVAEPWMPAPEGVRSGEGQRLTPDAPHNSGRPPPPPGTGPHHTTPAARSPHRHAGQGDSVGPPHSHTRAHSTWVADPNSPPSGRAVGGGGAPDLRRPPQQQAGRGEPRPDRPPPSTQDRARDRGRTRGGAQTAWNGPTSTQCRDLARFARHTTQERGERTPRERERTQTQRSRVDNQKGSRTGLAERTDRVEWRTSERG